MLSGARVLGVPRQPRISTREGGSGLTEASKGQLATDLQLSLELVQPLLQVKIGLRHGDARFLGNDRRAPAVVWTADLRNRPSPPKAVT